MSDKAWCETKKIQSSNLYYHIRRLCEKSCELPLTNHAATLYLKQEVVEIQMESLADTAKTFNSSLTEQAEMNTEMFAKELISIIRDTYNMDPSAKALYLFCGRDSRKIKALYFDCDGFVQDIHKNHSSK